MNFFIKFSLLALSIAGLAACAKDNTPPPSKLTAFTASRTASEVWSTGTGKGTNHRYLMLHASVDNDHVYAASATGQLSAYTIANGDDVWDVNTHMPFTAGPTAAHGLVFMGTSDARIVAFDEATGTLRWQTRTPSEVLAAPTVTADGLLLVKTIDGSLRAYDEKTGTLRWKYTQSLPSLILRGASSPIDAGTRIIAGFANGKLVAVDAQTGSLTWVQAIATPTGANPISNMVDIDAVPLLSNGIIYVATYQGNIAAVSEDTGAVIWQHALSSYSGIALDMTHVYATDAEGFVWAFDRSSGAVLWVQKALQYRVLTGPVLMQNTIAVADKEGYIHWLSPDDGHFVARTQFDSHGVLATPTVVNDTLYIFSQRGELAAYQLASE